MLGEIKLLKVNKNINGQILQGFMCTQQSERVEITVASFWIIIQNWTIVRSFVSLLYNLVSVWFLDNKYKLFSWKISIIL